MFPILLLVLFSICFFPTSGRSAEQAEQKESWINPFHEGIRALNEKRFNEAIDNFRKAVAANADATQPYIAIRSAYGQMGREQGAGATDVVDLAEARKALDEGKLDQAETILSKLLQDHFANPHTHALLRRIYHERGKSKEASHELKIFSGLLDAIFATGDGKTPESAFLVQSISEEYVVAMRLQCNPTGHALRSIAGRDYDVLTVSCGSEKHAVYFDISAFFSTDPTIRLKVYQYERGVGFRIPDGHICNGAAC